MSVRASVEHEYIKDLLGAGGEVEVVPMFVPIQTYRILLELGKERGISPADVLANAILLYAQPKQDIVQAAEPEAPSRQPDLIIKRKR